MLARTPEPTPFLSLDPLAFTPVQMLSKIWLCEELEKSLPRHCEGFIRKTKPRTARIWVLGGRYCLMNVILRARGVVPVRKVISLDLNPQTTQMALAVNDTYVQRGEFEAHVQDINDLQYTEYGGAPDVVINTACHCVEDEAWFYTIPDGTLVVLQSDDRQHPDCVATLKCAGDLADEFNLGDVWSMGSLPVGGFNRLMVIGRK